MLIFPPCKIFFLFASLRRKIGRRLVWTIFIIHDLPAIALLHCELFRYITRSMFLISFSNIPVNYFLIHQPIVFLYERGLLIYIIYLIRLISFLCSYVNFLSSLTCQLVRCWSHDFDFFALYCRNSNVQYQGPFKVRPWISGKRQSFPILRQTQNWHLIEAILPHAQSTTLSHAW